VLTSVSHLSFVIQVPEGVEGAEDFKDRCLFSGDASLSIRLPSPASQPGTSLAGQPLTVRAAAKGHLPFGARQTKGGGDARGTFGSAPGPDSLKGSPPLLSWFEERDGVWTVTRTKKMQEGAGRRSGGEDAGGGWKRKRKKGGHEEH